MVMMKCRVIHLRSVKLLGFWGGAFLTFASRRIGGASGDKVVTIGSVAVADTGEVAISATETRIGFEFREFVLKVFARYGVTEVAGCNRDFGGEILKRSGFENVRVARRASVLTMIRAVMAELRGDALKPDIG